METINQFLSYLHNTVNNANDEQMLELYSHNFIVEFKGHKVAIPFDAVTFNSFVTALMEIDEQV